jgi:hypothetical protein
VVIIGLNERLEVSATSANNNSRTNSYFSNAHYQYHFRDISNSENIYSESKANGKDSRVQAYDRDTNEKRDVLYKGRFPSTDAWRRVEGWPNGRPEFKVVIGYVERVFGSATAKTTTKYLDEKGWVKRNLFSHKLLTKTINIPILTWYKDRYGLEMNYLWVELDAGGNNPTELTVSLTTKFDDNTSATVAIKTTIDDNDKSAGDSPVQYEHATRGEGTWYSTGTVEFSVTQEL